MRIDRSQLLAIALALLAGVMIGRASVARTPAPDGAPATAAGAGNAPLVDPSMLTSGEPSPEMIAAIRRQALRGQRAYAAAVAPLQALTLMKMHLRETITAEEAYMAENGAYTDDYSRLALMDRGDSVTVTIRWAGPAGWAAEATHPAFADGSCVAAGGLLETIREPVATRREGRRSETPFHIACDAVPEP